MEREGIEDELTNLGRAGEKEQPKIKGRERRKKINNEEEDMTH